jgi:hypothetical protein
MSKAGASPGWHFLCKVNGGKCELPGRNDPGGAREASMAKYGRKAGEKVARAMRERKRGTLRSGRSGKKVTSRKQAIAIGLSEARRAGGKVPRKRTGERKGAKKR